MDYGDVCVLVPTYNEVETIGDVVADFREAGFDDVLVVDGGSDDDTDEIADREGARVVFQSGSGKGQAVREGIREYVDREYVLMLDGDATYDVDDAAALLEPLREGDARHVIGNRFADLRKGAMSRFNQVGNRVRGKRSSHLFDSAGLKLAATLVLTAPFIPMLFQGEEWGVEEELSDSGGSSRTVSMASINEEMRSRRTFGSSSSTNVVASGWRAGCSSSSSTRRRRRWFSA